MASVGQVSIGASSISLRQRSVFTAEPGSSKNSLHELPRSISRKQQLLGTMSAGVSVRAATEADADAIAPLVEELGYPADRWIVRQRLSRLVRRSDCLVAVAQSEGGEISGWLQALHSEVLESGPRVELVGLVTAKAMRRHGVGRLLVAFAESWALGLGVHAIVVRSNVKRAESHGFYAALGYANIKTQNVYRKSLT